MRISDWSSDVCSSDLRGWNASGSSGDPASALVPHSPQRATPGPHVPNAMAIAAAILLIVLNGLSLNRLGMFGSRPIPVRSEARRVGKACGSKCRSRGAPKDEKKNNSEIIKKLHTQNIH